MPRERQKLYFRTVTDRSIGHALDRIAKLKAGEAMRGPLTPTSQILRRHLLELCVGFYPMDDVTALTVEFIKSLEPDQQIVALEVYIKSASEVTNSQKQRALPLLDRLSTSISGKVAHITGFIPTQGLEVAELKKEWYRSLLSKESRQLVPVGYFCSFDRHQWIMDGVLDREPFKAPPYAIL